jgi:hypothetical protein
MMIDSVGICLRNARDTFIFEQERAKHALICVALLAGVE